MRTNWSTAEIATARKLSAEGKTSPEIAAVVGRPAASVRRVLCSIASLIGNEPGEAAKSAESHGFSTASFPRPLASSDTTAPREVMGRVRSPLVTVGAQKPGRYRVLHLTDPHFGSKFNDALAFRQVAQWAVDEGATAVVCTGDILDGQKACLAYEQRCIGADDQATEAVEVWSASAISKLPCVAIGGNHDGYAHSATGIDYGSVLRDRMREAGLDWHYLGQCLGRALVHGAKWELWHPMGAGSTRNAVRRILNARAEAYQAPDRPDVLAIGHYHRHTSFMAYPERVFCVSGGTFQRKGSEFANRITGGWDVGAGIVSYTVRADGSVGEFAAEFFAVGGEARGWAA